MNVYLAYYHTGYTCDPPDMLLVCSTRRMAKAMLSEHKRERDTTKEFGNRAKWWVKRMAVCTSNKNLRPDGRAGQQRRESER